MRRFAVPTFWIATVVLARSAAALGVQDLVWLQGCWTMAAGDWAVEEQWMRPLGGTMLGAGRTVEAGRLVEYEFLVIREEGDQLLAWIEGPRTGQTRRIEFRYQRASGESR
jgi:hypothetical protein